MELAQELRRLGITLRKRLDFFKYNLQIKRQIGAYNPQKEGEMIETQRRSMNLFDFSKAREFYLLDAYSDATEYGGESEMQMQQITDDNCEKALRLTGRFVKERNNLLPIEHMFFGFRSLSLFKTNFQNFNGLRITMKPPIHPCKLGLYLASNFREYEHFIGHLLDTQNPNKDAYLQYELPLRLMMNNMITTKVVQQVRDEDFTTKGLTFTVESTHESKVKEGLTFDIQKIDAVFNPEYEQIFQNYKHPVFFKSLPSGLTFADQGFLDNGRGIFNIGNTMESNQKSKTSINSFAYEQPQEQSTNNNNNQSQSSGQRRSIKDRIQQ